MCASDGWEDILRVQQDIEAEVKAAAESAAAEAQQHLETIPANTDHLQVGVPADGGRELVPCEDSIEDLQAEAAYYREKYRLKPTKPRRNLEALRRVEVETREAMEKEAAIRAEKSAACQGQTSIRTKPDVVRID